MLRYSFATLMLTAALLFAASASAQTPDVPIGPSGLASGVLPLGPGAVVLPVGPSGSVGVGGGPPPGCSNSLDFSQACNSQYINVVGL